MRLVFALVLVAGMGLAGFAVFMAQNYMSEMSAERDKLLAAQAAAPPMVDIVVVTKDKAYGQVLKKDDVKWMRWQKDSLPKGAFVRDAEGFDEGTVQAGDTLFPEGKRERFVITSMSTFEPLLAHKVTNPGEDAGLTSRLGKGMRAFAIRVDVTSGVSGFLRPGDRVDVYWTGSRGGPRQRRRYHQADRVERQADRRRPDRRYRAHRAGHRPHRDRRGLAPAGGQAHPGTILRQAVAVAGGGRG